MRIFFLTTIGFHWLLLLSELQLGLFCTNCAHAKHKIKYSGNIRVAAKLRPHDDETHSLSSTTTNFESSVQTCYYSNNVYEPKSTKILKIKAILSSKHHPALVACVSCCPAAQHSVSWLEPNRGNFRPNSTLRNLWNKDYQSINID